MKKYCADLQGGMWLQFDTATNQWHAKPCCLYRKSYPIKSNIDREFWNHPEILDQRKKNLDGENLPIECRDCKFSEDSGTYSRRMSWNDRLGTEWKLPASIIEIDVQSDFACNLACSICGPALSTTWRKFDSEYKQHEKKFKVRVDKKSVVELLSTANIQDLRQIHFQGGEPLLNYTHVDILNEIEKHSDISKIIVWYHSNGTQRVPEKVLEYWKKFQLVEIYFSLDDMGPRMEYQRWPVKWEDLHKNMIWYKENVPSNTLLRVERTVSVLNALWVTELDQWQKEYFNSTCYGDEISINYHSCKGVYSLESLSREYKNAILESVPSDHWVHKTISQIIPDQDKNIMRLLDTLEKQDRDRGLNWKQAYPDFLNWYSRYL